MPDLAGTAIIIACLASFRQLFTNLAHRERRQDAAGSSPRRLLNYLRSKAKYLLGAQKKRSRSQLNGEASCSRSNSEAPIVPLKSIHVSHNISIPYLSRRDRQED